MLSFSEEAVLYYVIGEVMNKALKNIKNWIVYILGLYKNSDYVVEYQRVANVRSSIYMAVVVMILEVWMILRYVIKYVIPGKYEMSVPIFFHYTRYYWILLLVAVGMCIYASLYITGKIKKSSWVTNLCIILFSGSCLAFGIQVSYGDFSKGRMIICFLTMVLYVACLLIWRPAISIALLSLIAAGFYQLLETKAVSPETGLPVQFDKGDYINYITFFITLTMVAISIYQQRHREAVEAEKLYQSTIRDELTGIPNVSRFSDLANEYIERAPEGGLIYLFFNIENFRTLNDQMGYDEGDAFLRGFAMVLSDVFEGEPYGRLSDDHFIALTGADGYEDRIDRLRSIVHEHSGKEVYLDVKVGGFRPGSGDISPMRCADRARYAAGFLKNKSDVYYSEYDDKMDQNFRTRQYVLNNIDKAIKDGNIHVYYQPVMWSKDKKLCGCEALARWIDDEHGVISPGIFIPVLEECRQIHKLDKCIYEIVCRDMRRSLDEGRPVLPTSINFSRLDFELMDAVNVLEELVEKYDIEREYLHVEITESALTSDVEGLKAAMDQLRDKGYELWLDDFGSGYSSMNVLKDFRFDLLKIDMVFLKGFSENPNSGKILKNIIDLADNLGMRTLTEGVETTDSVDFLSDAGCGRLQGYFFGKPMPYDELYKKISDGEYEISSESI